MLSSREIAIIQTKLSLENLILQDKLQDNLNSNQTIDFKVSLVLESLKNLVQNDQMIVKFNEILNAANNTNTNTTNG